MSLPNRLPADPADCVDCQGWRPDTPSSVAYRMGRRRGYEEGVRAGYEAARRDAVAVLWREVDRLTRHGDECHDEREARIYHRRAHEVVLLADDVRTLTPTPPEDDATEPDEGR